jgi:hypothetical protein
MLKRHGKGGLRTDRGAVQIEFILSFLVIMFVLFAMWELIMIVHTMSVLSDAAKEGVRCAIVSGRSCTPAEAGCPYGGDVVKCQVWSYARLSFHDISAVTVEMIPATLPAPGERVRVSIRYDFVPYTALPYRPTLSAVAEGRVVF